MSLQEIWSCVSEKKLMSDFFSLAYSFWPKNDMMIKDELHYLPWYIDLSYNMLYKFSLTFPRDLVLPSYLYHSPVLCKHLHHLRSGRGWWRFLTRKSFSRRIHSASVNKKRMTWSVWMDAWYSSLLSSCYPLTASLGSAKTALVPGLLAPVCRVMRADRHYSNMALVWALFRNPNRFSDNLVATNGRICSHRTTVGLWDIN